MSADWSGISGPAGDGQFKGRTSPPYGSTSLRVSPSSGSPRSPLQRFVEAKTKINVIFNHLEEYVNEASKCLHDLAEKHDFVSRNDLQSSEQFKDCVNTIIEKLKRDQMKVVFFGRTSNGKSTVINAMLHSRVLPQGLGHTTRCFLQVEGSPSGHKFILKEDSEEPLSIENIDQLAHALCSDEVIEDTVVRILWPKTDSKLLNNEVVLVDSPGVDVSPKFDSWIDKTCLDADVFVLVANAESTLTQTEKNFFHRVSDKLSRPSIFILNNRWDASAAEPETMQKVREQHMHRLSHFLVNELKTCSAEEAPNRIFFVSAREMLHQRLKNKGLNTPTSILMDGYQHRTIEFANFEQQFETCISKSAIKTKFESHILKGRDIACDMHTLLDRLHSTVVEHRQHGSKLHQESMTQLRQSQTSLLQFISKSKELIQRLSAEVQLKVSSDMNDQVKRLHSVISSFSKPFSDDPNYLPLYKQDLVCYCDEILSNELNVRFTGGLLERILGAERDMLAGITSLLPEDYSNRAYSVLQHREPFRFAISLHCKSLAEDFQEDLEFRFSLGVSQLVRRFISFRRGQSPFCRSNSQASLFGGGNVIPRPMSTSASGADLNASDLGDDEDMVMKSILLSSASYVANGGVGLLLIGGLVYRSLGWKVIAIGCSAYVSLYAYERLRWNATAKEWTLKNQMCHHLQSRIKQLSHTLTINCESQVCREVQEVLSRLQGVASESHQEMKVKVDEASKKVAQLEGVAKNIANTRNQAKFLDTELDGYVNRYLQAESPR